MNDDTAKQLTEPELTDEELAALTPDELLLKINNYRKKINEGYSMDQTTHANSFRCLRQLRHRQIQSNPHATKAAKTKVEGPPAFDLSKFL